MYNAVVLKALLKHHGKRELFLVREVPAQKGFYLGVSICQRCWAPAETTGSCVCSAPLKNQPLYLCTVRFHHGTRQDQEGSRHGSRTCIVGSLFLKVSFGNYFSGSY